MRKRWPKRLAKALLLLMTLLVAFLVFERVRGQLGLASYKKKLLAQGEKLSPRDFTQTFAEAYNGAPTVIAAIERLKSGTVLPANPPPRMNILPSGRALIGFREPEWVEVGTYRDGEWVNEKVTNRWDQLALDLRTNAAVFAEIRAALGQPVLNNQLDLAEGSKLKFTYLAPVKSLANWLGSGAQLALHQRNNQEVLDYLLPEIRVSRLLAEDRIVISELVRFAISAIARADSWEALQSEGWSDQDLAQIQAAWAQQDFIQGFAHSMEGERVFCDVSCETLRRSNDDTYDSIFTDWGQFLTGGDEPSSEGFGSRMLEIWNRQIYCRLWRFAWSHQSQRRTLVDLTFLVNQARAAVTNRSYGPIQTAIETQLTETERRNFYDGWRFPEPDSFSALARAISRAMKAETDRSLTLCGIALKRHFLRHGKYPASLEALVPEFLPAVPIDYMDGKPIKYQLEDNDTFILYSVGEDGQDHGGDLSLPDGSRNRDLWRRRDYVWPAPATPEDVVAWREEAHRK